MSNNIKNIIDDTNNLIILMMNEDQVDNNIRTEVLALVNLTLTAEKYIKTIKEQIKLITADGVFNQNDIPAVLNIIIQSKLFLHSVLASGTTTIHNLDMSIMKYIIFAVLHFVLVVENANPTIITSVDSTFSSLWTLIAFNPKELMTDVSSLTQNCFPCLFKSTKK